MFHPTMRTISGVPSTDQLAAATTALIVIDFQMEYFDGGRLPIPDGKAAMSRARQLVDFGDRHGIAVIHVQHLGPAGGALFPKDSDRAAFHADMAPRPQHLLVQKTTASSFASTDLHQRLQARGIKTLVLCGLMTHMCISTTARDAKPLGYQVLVAGDACATRDIEAWDGGIIGHAELHRAALTEISDAFGEVVPTDSVLALPVAPGSVAAA
ncbi:cysteine hydrolase family protein [Noviherbaspirillum saxi]|uniref:Cysteine hydrolase n=1 Tax=Noviherbaspirillum saxi TaxID=2320863 RepID=A0A3A3FVV0_9BURK|nr:cysteine hydrolase family protein [Noviherbaspirillum saxi]RJF99883.1 cysteine hydrolase [Noviherbaspirillum saxi]